MSHHKVLIQATNGTLEYDVNISPEREEEYIKDEGVVAGKMRATRERLLGSLLLNRYFVAHEDQRPETGSPTWNYLVAFLVELNQETDEIYFDDLLEEDS